MAIRASEEPVSDERRENHARHFDKNDIDSGLDVVRQRETKTKEGEQDDVVT